MKHVTLVLFFLLSLTACKKEEPLGLDEQYDASQATLVSQASFTTNAHTTSGTVKVYTKNGTKSLVFTNFKTDNGPDLRVYLSRSNDNTDFTEVGMLKSTSGNFYYAIDTTINTTDYSHVLIWCADFSALFGSAQLQ